MTRHRHRQWHDALGCAFFLVALSLAPAIDADDAGEPGQAAPRAIDKGPYLQNVSTGNVTVCWSTDTASGAKVYYSKDLSYSLSVSDNVLATFHEMRIGGLEAGTTYNYYVVSGLFQSPVSTFRTAPAGSPALRFGVYGDTRTNLQNHTNVIKLMHSYDPAFHLNCGDLVTSGISQADWDMFFGIISPYSNDTAYWPAIGNHDVPATFYEMYFSLPGNERWYSFDYGAVHIVALDTTSDFSNGSAQNVWLRTDLDAASNADWSFVFFHHPPYSTGAHGSDMDVRTILCPIFEEHRVTAVFSGHDHDYEHADPGDGIQYFVTGGGGAPLAPVGHSPWTVYSEMVYHFLTVDVTGNLTTVTAIRENGPVMETVRISLRDRTVPAPPSGLKVTGVSYDHIDLAWNPNAETDLDGYRVFINDTGAGPAGPFHNISSTIKGTDFRAGGLAMNTAYSFVLAAVDKAAPLPNNSTFSNVATCTTLARVPNSPPVALSPLPAPVIEEDAERPAFIAYSSVFADPDGDMLLCSVRSAWGLKVAPSANGTGIDILPQPDFNGRAFVLLAANDSQFEAAANLTVTVIAVNDIPVISGLAGEWYFPEDSLTGYVFQAEDRADKDSNFVATTDIPALMPGLREGANYWLNRSVGADGIVSFRVSLLPDNAMVGTYRCNVTVRDSDGGRATASVLVTVQNVNDPPRLSLVSPKEGQVFQHNGSIMLTAEASDDDILFGDTLKFEWLADGESLGARQNLTGLSLVPGDHTITLTVTDASNATVRASVNITVLKAPPPYIDKPFGSTSGMPFLAMAAVTVTAALIAALLLVRRRKK